MDKEEFTLKSIWRKWCVYIVLITRVYKK